MAPLARSAGLTPAVPQGTLRGVVLFCGFYDLRTVGSTGFPSLRTELGSVLKRKAVPLTTLFWAGTGDHLSHEYQFDFDLPQARTAFQRTLAFLTAATKS